MEIGIVHYTAPRGEVGGIETVIDYHSKFLTKEGHKVNLIYGTGGGLDYKNVSESKIPLLSSTNPDIMKIQKQLLVKGSSKNFNRVKKEIKRTLLMALKGTDVCIVHNIPSMPYNFAATAAINDIADETEIRMIFWVHDGALIRPEWKSRIGKFPLTLLHHRAANVSYVSPTHSRAREFAALSDPYRISEHMMTVIPNGVSIEDYLKIDNVTKQLMGRLGLSFKAFIILVPVRVTPRKNIELSLFVLEKLKRLVGNQYPIKLLITGPPEREAVKGGVKYPEHLQGLIEELGLRKDVIFCHELIARRREYKGWRIVKWGVADAYNIASIVFVPSKEEGFGLPVIEAGAARKPIFCSRIPPFRELIRDDIEGYMFSLDDNPEDIALKIYKFLLGDKLKCNFDNIINNFTWDAIIKKKLLPYLNKKST